MLLNRNKSAMPAAHEALPGRDARPFSVGDRHLVLGTPIETNVPEGYAEAVFGTGCFWGAEEELWQLPGVWSTSVGYAGGSTPNPTYEEVCTGRTGHAEVVRVIFDPAVISYEELLKRFWESHDPTQGMRQGNDIGTQYRSVIFWVDDAQRKAAEASREAYQRALERAGLGEITTAIVPLERYWYAEDHHQQYLAKNAFGYRCHANTGVKFPA